MTKARVTSRSSSGSRFALALSVCALMLSWLASDAIARAQSENSDERKIVSRTEPDYPEALKKLYIGGVVRVEVLVAPNGAVKNTKLLGGSPILGQSTMKAIRQWKYVPAASEQTLTVRMEFDPHR